MEEVYLGVDSQGFSVYRTYGQKNDAYRIYRAASMYKEIIWYVNPLIIKGLQANIVTNSDEYLVRPEPKYFDKLEYFKKLEDGV